MSSDLRPEAEPTFAPFADDAAIESLGGLTLENGRTRIALHGALDLTKDRRGLARARRLRSLLDTIVAALEAEPLPEEVAEDTRADRRVPNPFA